MTEFLKARHQSALNPPDHSERVTNAVIADIDVVAEREKLEEDKAFIEAALHKVNMRLAELPHEG